MYVEGEGVALTTGETFDNEKNLPQRFLERLRSVYKNTRVAGAGGARRIVARSDRRAVAF
jgi:hypothetical protein